LKENEGTIRQLQSEVDRLGSRETSLAGRMKDMETNMEEYSLPDIKAIYNTAHETQMRLLMMRQQLDTLQAKQKLMKEKQSLSNKVAQLLNQRPKNTPDHGIARVTGTGSTQDAQEMVSKIIQAQENERLRVSIQLHDGPAQAMSNLVLRAEICERWMDADSTRAKMELGGLKSMVNETLQETRRFIFDLRPMILNDLGLLPTMRRYIKDYSEKNKIDVNMSISGRERRLPNHVEVAIFRIIQEALGNVAKHAEAMHVQLLLDLNENMVSIVVEDDGVGFDINKLKLDTQTSSLGISSMGQRIDMLGGQLNIESTVGRGTRINALIPITQ
jgi:two-component system sensor histidine kinase DegS